MNTRIWPICIIPTPTFKVQAALNSPHCSASIPTGSSRRGDAEVGEADGGEPCGAEPGGRPPVQPALGVAQLAHDLLPQEAVLDAGEPREGQPAVAPPDLPLHPRFVDLLTRLTSTLTFGLCDGGKVKVGEALPLAPRQHLSSVVVLTAELTFILGLDGRKVKVITKAVGDTLNQTTLTAVVLVALRADPGVALDTMLLGVISMVRVMMVAVVASPGAQFNRILKLH